MSFRRWGGREYLPEGQPLGRRNAGEREAPGLLEARSYEENHNERHDSHEIHGPPSNGAALDDREYGAAHDAAQPCRRLNDGNAEAPLPGRNLLSHDDSRDTPLRHEEYARHELQSHEGADAFRKGGQRGCRGIAEDRPNEECAPAQAVAEPDHEERRYRSEGDGRGREPRLSYADAEFFLQ